MTAEVQAAVLQVEGLRTHFRVEGGTAPAVDGIDFAIEAGRTTALVGESGCGKSVTALSVMALMPSPPAIRAGGRVLFEGRDLLAMAERDLRPLRGSAMAMIFQEPMTSLNPVITVGEQVAEVLRLHRKLKPRDAMTEAVRWFSRVGLPDPERRVSEYSHQLSGGMRQRVMIAMALCCGPRLLIADEPTTALDVTVQAQILDLLRDLQRELGMAILFITHDLGVVAEIAHDVAVMYAGHIVEQATVDALFARPRHPYTVGLFRSLPDPDRPVSRLDAIPGSVPQPLDLPSGCRFRNRCAVADARCADEQPALIDIGSGHQVACHALEEGRLDEEAVSVVGGPRVELAESAEEAETVLITQADGRDLIERVRAAMEEE